MILWFTVVIEWLNVRKINMDVEKFLIILNAIDGSKIGILIRKIAELYVK